MSEMGKTAVLAALKKTDAAKDRFIARQRAISLSVDTLAANCKHFAIQYQSSD